MNKTQLQQEIKAIIYLMRLKKVTRFGFIRPEHDPTESVAEHVYGLMVLAKYFLPCVDPEQGMDHQCIYDMILWHDTGEIETGDIPMFFKTQQNKHEEMSALEVVRDAAPAHLAGEVYDAAAHYESKKSTEQSFVKALDKLESAFSLLASIDTAEERFALQKVTYGMYKQARIDACGSFPLLLEFALEIGIQLDSKKVFYESS